MKPTSGNSTTPARTGQERLRATEEAFNRQLARNRQASATAKASVRRIRPWWLVGGGLLSGVIVAALPTRAVAAAVGAAAGFAVRLMATPVGPMAVGALLGVRKDQAADDTAPAATPANGATASAPASAPSTVSPTAPHPPVGTH